MNSTAKTKILAIAAVIVGVNSMGALECIPESPIDPSDFVDGVDNPFFPLAPGTLFVYQKVGEDGTERVEFRVTADRKEILGVSCVVVRDMAFLDDELIEDTLDWFAQDENGNVWYFGEFAQNFEGGVLINTDGSWEAGVEGAEPGIVMQANPVVGQLYNQENAPGIAEDMAEVLSLTESVTVPFGTFDKCLETRDFSPLDPGVNEFKFYASGVGQVLTLEEGERLELISVTVE